MASSDVDWERTDQRRRIVVSRDVAATREAAWDLLTDTERWAEWGPSVRAVESEARYIESGTTGRVQIPGGIRIPFEITTCEDFRWHWRVARVPATGHRVTKAAEGSRVAFELSPLAAPYIPVCTRALGRIAALLEA
jgi:carbon monoxide dehydrogenase subunit G